MVRALEKGVFGSVPRAMAFASSLHCALWTKKTLSWGDKTDDFPSFTRCKKSSHEPVANAERMTVSTDS